MKSISLILLLAVGILIISCGKKEKNRKFSPASFKIESSDTAKEKPKNIETFNDDAFGPAATLEKYSFDLNFNIGQSADIGQIKLGGLSGLYLRRIDGAKLNFLTLTDRGPNAEKMDLDGDGIKDRPFALPGFQPLILSVEFDRSTGKSKILKNWPLEHSNGQKITGLPNVNIANEDRFFDESPYGLDGKRLDFDLSGVDTEGITIDANGTPWIVEEYGPSILKLNSDMQVVNRYIPKSPSGKKIRFGIENIPSYLARRKRNRGFEGVTFHDGQLIATLQSPIPSSYKKNRLVPILTFDTQKEQVTGIFLYKLQHRKAKLGGLASFGKKILVIEQLSKTKPPTQKHIYAFKLDQATNILNLPEIDLDDDTIASQLSEQEINLSKIKFINKELFVDLGQLGLNYVGKLEGITTIDDNSIAIVNDDDFGVGGFKVAKPMSTAQPQDSSTLFIIRRQP